MLEEKHFDIDKGIIIEKFALNKFMGVIGGLFYLLNVRLIYKNTISKYTVNFKFNVLLMGILRLVCSLGYLFSKIEIFYFLDQFFKGYMFMTIMLHIALLYRYYHKKYLYWGIIVVLLSCSSV